jgi:MFS transporter, putative metabolite:H+ symporter
MQAQQDIRAQQYADVAARLDRLPTTGSVWRLVTIISLGGFFEFYDLFFTGYVAPGMVASGLFKPESLGLFASLAPLKVAGFGVFVFATFAGLWVGTLAFGQIADRFGRRSVFTASLIWYSVTTAIMAFQATGFDLVIWRFIAGIGIGVELVTIDAYISELVPPAARGRAFCLNQFIMFLAVPICAVLAWGLKGTAPVGLDYWRVIILVGSAGALVVWFIRRGLPESPRWLARHGRGEEALAIVADLERRVDAESGGTLPAPGAAIPEDLSGAGSLAEAFAPPYLGRTIILSVFNAAQVVGFYGFAAWVPTLLMHRGVNITSSLEYSFYIAIASPFGPLLGALFADRIERKTQIIAALVTMGVAMALFAQESDAAALIALGVVFTLASNIMSYAFHGYQAEVYPTRIRARAIGFVYSWSRLVGAFAGLAIALLLEAGGVPLVAVFIGAAMAIGVVAIALGPSTRGLGLEAISR